MNMTRGNSILLGPITSIRNLIEFREVTSHLIRREIKGTYGAYALGYGWTLLEPILFTIVFYMIFVILRGEADELLPLSIMIGILVYSCFSRIVTKGTHQLVKNSALIHQVAFPREVLVAGVSGFQLLKLSLSLIIAPLYMIYSGIPFTITLLLLPVAIIGITIFAHGIALVMTIMNVYLRDTVMIVDVALRALFFLSGVFYAASHVPPRYLKYHMMNPIAVYIEIARAAIIGDTSFLSITIIMRCIIITISVFVFGSIIFNKYERKAVIRI